MPRGGRLKAPLLGKTSHDFHFIFIHWMKIKQKMVAGDGIEPPTRGFSIPCSTS
jgi:hypothetical protein